jgi:hypothetical protein
LDKGIWNFIWIHINTVRPTDDRFIEGTKAMGSDSETSGADALRAVYSAVVAYHNSLVQMRFTIAGLFLAANGLLAGGLFQASVSALPGFAVPALGMLLAFVCWLLEVRTYQLLENLGARGLELEAQLGVGSSGFFALMAHQPIGPRLLLTPLRLPANKVVRYFVSHSMGVGLLYNMIGLFWLVVLVVQMAGA